jgi:hypothetical protein
MLVLQATTDTLEVVLGGAITTNQLPVVSSWRDITTTGYTPGRSNINTNSTTAIIAVAAPAASTYRVIDHVSIYNADTAAATVTVRIDANATEYTLVKVTLGIGERLEFAEGEGWTVLDTNGAVKNVNATNGIQTVVLASDVTNANASANTIADVTGLSFAVVSGSKYWFKFTIPYTSAATTTGSRWAINGPAAPTLLNYTSRYTLTATSETVNSATAYDIPAASNATSLTAGNLATIEGIIVPSANGTVIARFASEVTVSAVVAKAGAILQYQLVA